ncbi:unnamed protein product [Rotaria magnacalcarata]|uniref:Uncharacterized protein n=1 Tax=Rotaria magnacalcarata TaxID=392030 RepID=A0A816Z4D8_9BILA|nr:unnamed protein product [Rotaria magnacalcarata]
MVMIDDDANGDLVICFCMIVFVPGESFRHAHQAIVKSFVPDNLGFGHVTPQDVIGRHTTAIARELMCGGDSTDTEIIIIDGTYLYIQAGGARFHGCRSHISLAIWFLTHQQWQTQQRHMPSVECKNLATDSIQISDFYDSSDDDDSQPYSLA